MTALALHSRSCRAPRRSPIPKALVRDLLAVGLLTEYRPPARRRLERKIRPETLAAVRRLLDIR
jgi:hypothetical protein